MKKIIIIGAGPAGLTAGYELLKDNNEYELIILEETSCLGGISKTVNYKGNRMDMGGHRFFSKSKEVNDWWENLLPMQGSPSLDDILLNRTIPYSNGPDPEKNDAVMLFRNRVSRIFFNNNFYDYPISIKFDTFKNMGLINSFLAGMSYIKSAFFKRKEDNLENFYINRFGKKLYSMFFEYYTENLWGRHPREIDASWGKQRVKGLSIAALIKNGIEKILNKKNRKIETSLIENFKYPKFGPGQMWETAANEICKMGGQILLNSKVISLKQSGHNITSVTYEKDGQNITMEADIVISSMPIKDLIKGLNDVPENTAVIAQGLPYRDYMTLGVLVSKLKLKNKTKIKTVNNIIPDCWVYVQDKNIKTGRIQIYNNWSPYMVKDFKNSVWIGLEYFVFENDNMWNMDDTEFAKVGISEMIKIGLIESENDVLDYHAERVKKAYPAYFDTYDKIDEIIKYLSSIENLYCVGRNGQHRYNNIDHSMMTSFEAVKNIKSGNKDKSNIWNVNTEKVYHEQA